MRPVRRPARTRRLLAAVVGVLAALSAGALDPLTSVAQPTSVSVGTPAAPAAPAATSAVASPVPGTYTAVTPYRALDTRNRTGVPGTTPVGALGTVTVAVGRTGGVPTTGVSAVMATVTVVGGSAPGYLTSWASGTARPVVSTLNWADGRPLANSAVVPVGADGRIALYNGSSRPVHVVVDVEGWYAAGTVTTPGGLTPVTPRRVLDTRSGINAQANFPFETGSPGVEFPVAPAGTGAAAWLNVTTTDGRGAGWIAADATMPGDDSVERDTTSVVSWTAGRTSSNLVLARVRPDGRVYLHAGGTGTVHVIADLLAVVSAGSLTTAGTQRVATVFRQLDTRRTGGAVPAGGTLAVPLSIGRLAPQPGDVAAATVTVTVAAPSAPGYLSGVGADGSVTATSLMNWAGGQTTSVTTTLPVGTDGRVRLRTSSTAPTHLVVDLLGTVLAHDVPQAPGWTAQRVELGSPGNQSPYFTSVSCGDRESCVATVNTFGTEQPTSFVVRYDQGRWGKALVFPMAPYVGRQPDGECSGSGLCVATLHRGGPGFFATSASGQSWTVTQAVGALLAGSVSVVAPSCATAGTTCRVLQNEYADQRDHAEVSTYVDGAWRPAVLPSSSSGRTYTGKAMHCRADDSCTVVGLTEEGPVASTFDGVAWNTILAPKRLGLSSLTDVRMMPDGSVLALGSTPSRESMLVRVGRQDGTGWSARPLAGTGVTVLPTCPAAWPGTCFVAASSGTDLAGRPHGPGMAQLPDLATTPFVASPFAQPGAIGWPKCTLTSCIATSYTAPRLVGRRPLVAQLQGDSWVTGLLPVPSDSIESELGTSGAGSACWSSGCLAITYYVDRNGHDVLGSATRNVG